MIINQLQKNIPNGWQLTKLTDVGVFSKGAEISKEQLSESGHNAIRYGELYTRHNIKVDKIYSFISDEIIPLTKKIKYGDILFAGSGETNDEIGKSATYLLKEDCYAGGDVIIFRPNNANSLFLAYFLNFGEGRKKLRELGQGQSIVHIYKSDMEEIKLHLPSLPEQNRIVSVLETWDKAIENLNKKIEIKKQIKKGLIQNLLTGNEVVKLGDICDIKTGKKDVNEGNPDGKYPFFTCAKDNTYSDNYSFDTEAILIAGNGEVGNCLYYNGKFEAYQRTYVLSNFKKEVMYVFPYLKYFFQNQINSQKQMGAMPYIKLGMLKNFEIKIPKDSKEQKKIANILTTTDKEITELEKKLSIIKNQKKFLLNNLITGAIRTPESMKIQT
ncbi:hypothetical protein A2641_00485 [Candidatus Nomurabacteria bacterium RIFCSPHIGHO2_01_FULL_37_25]|nr:MAG: hypothetical protein A2641_00485 [Candidatus Nomurabacteria bacterium RIFCSPHIGHO2_01_FULL_37_25]OGI76096.1 MAG: hypothetical protein A3D36_01590 [Candidatus Nomurabacteria bacterium RIFCSPHIGHO2_02_FULL_36_29]